MAAKNQQVDLQDTLARMAATIAALENRLAEAEAKAEARAKSVAAGTSQLRGFRISEATEYDSPSGRMVSFLASVGRDAQSGMGAVVTVCCPKGNFDEILRATPAGKSALLQFAGLLTLDKFKQGQPNHSGFCVIVGGATRQDDDMPPPSNYISIVQFFDKKSSG